MNELVEDTEAPPQRDKERADEGAHPAGLHRVLLIFASLAVMATIPYFVPQLEAYRAWSAGRPLPFTGLFEFRPPVQRPALAGGGQLEAIDDRSDDDLLASAPLPPSAPHTPSRPARADGGADGGRRGTPIAPRVPAKRLAGLTREIEQFDGHEMEAFYNQLASVGRREEGALARMMVYSVSTNGADRVTSAVRHQLQELFGDGGKGFVHIAPGWSYQGQRDVLWEVHNFRTAVVNRGRVEGGRYGLGGVLATNMGSNSSVTFGTVDEGPSNRTLSRFGLYYQALPQGGEVVIDVDGEEQRRVSTAAEAVEDRVHLETLEPGPHQVTLRVGGGRLNLYGVTMETDGPGVVVDGLMLIGASVRALHRFDRDHLATQVRQRAPDLIVFWLGGNDVISAGFSSESFRESYGTTIERVRAGRPEASCLVVSVLDKGAMTNGSIRTRPYVEPVIAAQEQVARDQHCAFFNLYEATGGNGTMGRWFRAAPRLAVSDYTHLTEAGARVVGSLIARALLRGYDDYLESSER